MNNLKEIRTRRGLSQAQLAQLTGVSKAAIHYLEGGRIETLTPLTKKLLEKLSLQIASDGSFFDPFEDIEARIAKNIRDEVENGGRAINFEYDVDGDNLYHLEVEFTPYWERYEGDSSVGDRSGDRLTGVSISRIRVEVSAGEGMMEYPVDTDEINEWIRKGDA